MVDLSSLWAGPLCGQLLVRAGAVVVKVESPRRPDGTRRGEPAFFDWMNSGKLSYAVDFDAEAEALRRLLSVADIVIEGSRPAALRRRRLSADDVPGRPGRIWLRIIGYRDQPDRPAFGDDAAVAGGLVGADERGPVFCGDAIADPLSGLEATRAIGESLRRGGGEVIDVAMAQVAARYAALPPVGPPPRAASARRVAGIRIGRRQRGGRAPGLRKAERLMLIQRAVTLDGATVDIRVSDHIDEVADTLTPKPGEDVLDAAGGCVLPGLHDHHVHLYAAAAAATSMRVGPPQVRDRAALAAALANAEPGADGWIRAVGYHDSVAGELDRDALDAIAPAAPVRIQHRSGVLWILNSAGLARVGLPDHPDGQAAQHRLLGRRLGAQRNQPGRPQPTAQPLRRHRNHRCHTGSRHRRRGGVVGAAPPR